MKTEWTLSEDNHKYDYKVKFSWKFKTMTDTWGDFEVTFSSTVGVVDLEFPNCDVLRLPYTSNHNTVIQGGGAWEIGRWKAAWVTLQVVQDFSRYSSRDH